MNDASYVSGFVDGEGSFLVSFQQRSKMKTGIEVRPSFTLSQHQRNQLIVNWLKEFFGCGSVRFNRSDQTYKYEVRSLRDLTKIIIPHFDQFPLRTSKLKDYLVFKNICALMGEGKHLSREGLVEIIHQAYEMNNFGARKYEKQSLLKILVR